MTIDKAKALLEQDEIQQAQELLLSIVHDDNSNAGAILLLCGISTRTKNWALGADSFEHLVNLRPKSGLASSGLVQSYFNLGRYDDALKEIERFKANADTESAEAKAVLSEHQKVIDEIQGKR